MKKLVLIAMLLTAGCVSPSRAVELTITVVDADTQTVIPGARCNEDGCRLRVAPDENVWIEFSAPGYETRRQPYRINGRTDTTVALRRH